MAPTRDPYSILEVSRSATAHEIRSAYLRLAALYHPDKHQGNPLEALASEKLADLNWAYACLSNPESRRDYDNGGANQAGPTPFPSVRTARVQQRRLRWFALLIALPLVFRFGSVLVGGVIRLVRGALEAGAALRGTPALAGGMLLLVGGLAYLGVRGRRKRRDSLPQKTPESH